MKAETMTKTAQMIPRTKKRPTQHHDGGPTDHDTLMLSPGSEGEGGRGR